VSWLQGGAVLALLFLLWLGSVVFAARQTEGRWMGDDEVDDTELETRRRQH
jgi:hypothetical protein